MWQIALNHDTCFHALTLELCSSSEQFRIAMLVYTRSSISKLFLALEFHLMNGTFPWNVSISLKLELEKMTFSEQARPIGNSDD